ncbi:MAG: orotidine-5'-phosphate decarboxylase, partial [Halieaceae bacterium]|nr:orotidine-5'-phosphate decarboxylase [Halieaceae bacterium]
GVLLGWGSAPGPPGGAAGGPPAAVAPGEGAPPPPMLIGVTLLTSMSEADLLEQGYSDGAEQRVEQLACLAEASGMNGVVCSAWETPMLRQRFGKDFKLVTPGIRMAGDEAGDQRRVVTPVQASSSGSDFLVIGRPITGAEDPLARVQQILIELDEK